MTLQITHALVFQNISEALNIYPFKKVGWQKFEEFGTPILTKTEVTVPFIIYSAVLYTANFLTFTETIGSHKDGQFKVSQNFLTKQLIYDEHVLTRKSYSGSCFFNIEKLCNQSENMTFLCELF